MLISQTEPTKNGDRGDGNGGRESASVKIQLFELFSFIGRISKIKSL
jgi:hypothetical protein